MRVVIIGYGSIARKHVAALWDLRPDAEVYALRSRPDAAVIPKVTNIYNYANIAEVKPDFIILSNPTSLRGEVLQRVVPLGIPLFIEKPVLSGLSPVPALRAQIEEQKLLTYVACNLRFLGCLRYVHERIIDDDSLVPNEVTVYAGSYLPEWRPGANWRNIYSARSDLGGGVHLDMIHELDYLYWLFGTPCSVRATRRSASSLGIDSVDYANYQLTYERFSAGITLNYFRRDYKRTLELVFQEETWLIDLAANRVTDHADRLLFKSTDTILDTYQEQMRYFLALLSGNRNSFNTFTDGVAVLNIALSHE